MSQSTDDGSDQEPVAGWRRALVVRQPDGTWAFAPLVMRGGAFRAEAWATCHARMHLAPDPECRCGWNAWWSREDAEGYETRRGGLLLEVEGAGRVVEHEHGWRAEWQRVLSATAPGLCRCGEPGGLFVRKDGVLAAACAGHAANDWERVAAADVAAGLGTEVKVSRDVREQRTWPTPGHDLSVAGIAVLGAGTLVTMASVFSVLSTVSGWTAAAGTPRVGLLAVTVGAWAFLLRRTGVGVWPVPMVLGLLTLFGGMTVFDERLTARAVADALAVVVEADEAGDVRAGDDLEVDGGKVWALRLDGRRAAAVWARGQCVLAVEGEENLVVGRGHKSSDDLCPEVAAEALRG